MRELIDVVGSRCTNQTVLFTIQKISIVLLQIETNKKQYVGTALVLKSWNWLRNPLSRQALGRGMKKISIADSIIRHPLIGYR